MAVAHKRNWSLARLLYTGELGRSLGCSGVGPLVDGWAIRRPDLAGPAAYWAEQTRSGEMAESTVRDP